MSNWIGIYTNTHTHTYVHTFIYTYIAGFGQQKIPCLIEFMLCVSDSLWEFAGSATAGESLADMISIQDKNCQMIHFMGNSSFATV